METRMRGRILGGTTKVVAALTVCCAALTFGVSTAGATEVIYSNISRPLAGNVPSFAFEATSTSEFGGQVQFAGSARRGVGLTVGMSSWSCGSGSWQAGCTTTGGEKYAWPITLKVYEVGPENTVGPLVYQSTQTVEIPDRPSENKRKCTGAQAGDWYDSREATCYAGKLFRIHFTMGNTVLPSSKAIVSVAYNTTDWGYAPTHVAGPEESLNVAVTGAPTVGSDPLPADAYAYSNWPEVYAGLGAPDTFSLAGEWEGYQPEFEVTAH
jgi:hypothetical protein